MTDRNGSETPQEEMVWYDALGDNHYFLQAERRDDGWYVRRVTPLISQDERGYYRVQSWRRISDDMVEAFHEDHKPTRREKPSGWDTARLERA